jgi:large subunit ribosomal protein L35
MKRKTKSSLKKRFKITSNGLVKCRSAFTRHSMRKRSSRKLRESNTRMLSNVEQGVINKIIGV